MIWFGFEFSWSTTYQEIFRPCSIYSYITDIKACGDRQGTQVHRHFVVHMMKTNRNPFQFSFYQKVFSLDIWGFRISLLTYIKTSDTSLLFINYIKHDHIRMSIKQALIELTISSLVFFCVQELYGGCISFVIFLQNDISMY